jgi:hypothetical protein
VVCMQVVARTKRLARKARIAVRALLAMTVLAPFVRPLLRINLIPLSMMVIIKQTQYCAHPVTFQPELCAVALRV